MSDLERTKQAWLREIQRENKCYAAQRGEENGKPCHSHKCACALEQQAYIDDMPPADTPTYPASTHEPFAWYEPIRREFGGSLVERFQLGSDRPLGWKNAIPLYAALSPQPQVTEEEMRQTIANYVLAAPSDELGPAIDNAAKDVFARLTGGAK